MKFKVILFSLLFGSAVSQVNAQCPTLSMTGAAVNCYGDQNGSATVTVTGGTGTHAIQWSTGATTPSITGLAAGSYSVQVTDISGCSAVGVYVVNSPDPIIIPHTVTNVNCHGQNTGAIDISPYGGTIPYVYDWSNNGTGSFTDPQDLSSLTAGVYDIDLRDNNGCTQSKTISINQPNEPVSIDFVETHVSCFGGSDGAIDLTVYGGTAPYSYDWNSGQTSQDITGIGAGFFVVTVFDNKGCVNSVSLDINDGIALTTNMTTNSVSCFGDANGNVSVEVNGGAPPYEYQWENSSYQYTINNPTLTNVIADNYEVLVTDNNGCEITDNATIATPSKMTSSINGTNISCSGGNDGTIDVSVSGGTPGYTYSWSNSTGAMPNVTQDLVNVPADSYTVVITDANGCSNTETITLVQPGTGVTIPGNTTNVLCYGQNTGAIDISPVGGTAPYNYNWSNSQTTQDISGLFSGNYSITIVDANGCSYANNFTLTQPTDTLDATNTIVPVNCFNESNGVINMNPSGGTAPYSFNWANSSFQLSDHSEDLNNYPSDTYILEMVDNNNCIFRDTLFIPQPTLLENSLVGTNILCKNDLTGSIDQTVTGGTLPYSILWNNGLTTEDISGLDQGWYSVTVTDGNNCSVMDSVEITEPNDTLAYTFTTEDVVCNDGDNGEITIIPSGGTTPYSVLWSTGETTNSILDLTAGQYYFSLTDNNGCFIDDSIEIFQPEPLLLNEVIEPVSCFGLSDGDVDISPTGGSAPYSYTWYNSTFQLAAQGQDLVDFPADVYQLELRDTFNCITEVFMEITEPELLRNNFGSINVTCAGGFDGSIDLTVMGGNPGYTYQWSNGATTQDLTGVPLGTYSAIITDTKNCKDSTTVIIYQPDSIQIDFETVDVSCQDQFDGEAAAYPTGGTGDFTYEWNTGESTHIIEVLETGYYSVTATDVVGCQVTDSAFVSINLIDCIDPPNTITPNGDDYNDVWYIRNLELYPDAVVQIYNKWGNIVYQQSGVYTPWGGTYNGIKVPADVYYYIINLNADSQEPLKGTLTVIR